MSKTNNSMKEVIGCRPCPVAYVDYSKMKLSQLAYIIDKDWPTQSLAATPYIQAMSVLQEIDDHYYYDSGNEIVARFLANATHWRGQIARDVKKELRNRLDAYYGH